MHVGNDIFLCEYTPRKFYVSEENMIILAWVIQLNYFNLKELLMHIWEMKFNLKKPLEFLK